MRAVIFSSEASKERPACTLTQSRSSTSGNSFMMRFFRCLIIFCSASSGTSMPTKVPTSSTASICRKGMLCSSA